MIHLKFWSIVLLAVGADGYQPLTLPCSKQSIQFSGDTSSYNASISPKHLKANVSSAFATAALSAIILGATTTALPAPALANTKNAATITVEQFPPTSILVQDDLPVIGSLLSGTYKKVSDASEITKPSVIIKSPKDKVEATSDLFFNGHLEFDVDGKVNTHLNVDLAADEPGVAKVRISSNLIPALPYRNEASSRGAVLSALGAQSKGKDSDWYALTNLGSGETYYKNLKTGAVSNKKPVNIY